LQAGFDRTNELSKDDLQKASLHLTTDPAIIADADVIIVTVPTPIDEQNLPDLSPVISAMHTVGKHLKKGAIVVLESTVYPGVMEETRSYYNTDWTPSGGSVGGAGVHV
jgi:UDP-N-acetyl-D-galactosamine dehydrogenase